MSDDWLLIVPTRPDFRPSPLHAERARSLFRSLVPDADEVTAQEFDDVVFVDAGSNFEGIRCPSCGADLETRWWQGEMSRCFETHFRTMDVRTPCCGTKTALNELDYVWPVGFARWYLSAMNPRRRLDDVDRAALAGAIGTDIREIWKHI